MQHLQLIFLSQRVDLMIFFGLRLTPHQWHGFSLHHSCDKFPYEHLFIHKREPFFLDCLVIVNFDS